MLCLRTAFLHFCASFVYIPPPHKEREDEQETAHCGEEIVHAEIGRDRAAEQRPCEAADLLCGEEHAKHAALQPCGGMLRNHGVQRGLYAGEEESYAELHDSERYKCIGNPLQCKHYAGAGHRETHCRKVAAPRPEDAPEWCRDRARNPAEREHKSRNKHDVLHIAREILDVRRDDGHQDEVYHLRERAHDHHRAQDGNVPEVPWILLLHREWRGICRHRRLLDDEGEREEIDEERESADVEAGAHPERLREHAAKQRTDDAARRQCALQYAEGEAEALARRVECHDREIHRPEPRGKALKEADNHKLFGRGDDAAEEIADRDQETCAHRHEPLSLTVGDASPDRRHHR